MAHWEIVFRSSTGHNPGMRLYDLLLSTDGMNEDRPELRTTDPAVVGTYKAAVMGSYFLRLAKVVSPIH